MATNWTLTITDESGAALFPATVAFLQANGQPYDLNGTPVTISVNGNTVQSPISLNNSSALPTLKVSKPGYKTVTQQMVAGPNTVKLAKETGMASVMNSGNGYSWLIWLVVVVVVVYFLYKWYKSKKQ